MDGEVKDEYFEAAVKRVLDDIQSQTEIEREERKARNVASIEAHKTRFDKVLANLVKLQKRIERLKKSAKDGDQIKLREVRNEYFNLCIICTKEKTKKL